MIPIVDPKKNYWVIRADGGFYFNNFIKSGFVALSHIDDLEITSDQISENTLNIISLHLPYSAKTSRQNQVYRFIDKIKINDWVITIGKKEIAIGIVKSDPFLDGSGFEAKKYLLGLRRKVEWGTTIKRNEIPYDLQVGLKCNQSLFNITKYHESLYHTLFPFFVKGSKVHTSLKIKAQSNIKTKDIIQLFELIDGIDEFCQKLLNRKQNESTPSFVKAQFKSPGDIWAIYNDIKTNVPSEVFWFIGTYVAIFGNKLIGFDGIIDKESKQKILDFAISHLEKKKTKDSIQNLQISFPESDIYSKLPNSEKLRIEPILIAKDDSKIQ
ncbi:hypothetical protein [Comamonas sp. GB3 AK4-5]|uniref:hypothetical protein n=1 Tax=Comamonas sp. GB3 AK4-5 TaxID=3231487 RepID=UPI00351EF931